ncbi:hypothetical protein BZG36_01654 [Bifiguratus adelaidae]|uniref:Uncharacterized protein n=1 Tax=Bifiguratus adelaidae TaxID=1938954 RepID=A0A261Y490_9FUNG|nr:hypothetical protein BZG36_01654 [Bifiguratus adelaidae]
MGDTLKDIPEFFENDIGESIAARTNALASFRELGPPDLCHITKANNKPGVKELGSYHYISGVDASTSASLAAYLNSITYSVDESHAWFGKGSNWRIRSGIYCCFNAFSRVDIRVEVKIPGGVESYVVDLRGERHETTPEIWQETYLSAALRAILYSDDPNYRLAGYRKLDPIPNTESEKRFLEVVEYLFFKGWQLGSAPEIQVATSVQNHLTAAVYKYFSEAFRFAPAVELFEKMYKKDPEIASLLAQAYIGRDEETKAVKVLYEGLKAAPMSYPLLHTQVDFLRSKGRHDIALKLAKHAVNNTPSEFLTWAKLTDCYIDLGDFESALLTLNSCPMFTYSERDLHRMPAPARTHLPIKPDVASSGIMEEDQGRDGETDPTLFRLPAPALHGTFAKAYFLLTLLVKRIGWDELLKCRSSVFVMEEEYRIQKAAEEERKGSVAKESFEAAKVRRESLAETGSSEASKQDANEPSQIPVAHTHSDETETATVVQLQEEDNEVKDEKDANGVAKDEEGTKENGDGVEKEDGKEAPATEKEVDAAEAQLEEKMDDIKLDDEAETTPAQEAAEPTNSSSDPNHDIKENGNDAETLSFKPVEQMDLERPHKAAEKSGDEDAESKTKSCKQEYSFSFQNKRLCERWLDNLFMVLYEDLRVYTVWRTESAHYKAQQMPYRKSGIEWEILGDLAFRLHHKEEAKEAYQNCLDQKFSAKAWMRLLEIYADEGNMQKALVAAVKLTVYHERWYHEIVYPSQIAFNLNKLIRREGLGKLQNMLISMNLPPPVFKLVVRHFTWAETFAIEGADF